MDLLADLAARGLVHDHTDLDALRARLDAGPVTLYYGCDPTADSLHVGNMIGLLVLRRFQEAGHRPIALAGGATGMIGDPGGRSSERSLLDEDTLATNLLRIREQLARFVSFDHPDVPALLVDNRDWTEPLGVLDFLRDPGKHVTVNQMLAKESVRSRLAGEEGISYTEFSYMLLQANDYAWLAEHEDCELQIGGGDQWGNIALGVDLTRRRLGRRVHGLTWPLMVRSDGVKFGKTAGGDTLWLGAHRMLPYELFQAWMQVDDRDVRAFLLQLTMLSVDEAEEVAAQHADAPHRRLGQRRLAEEVTALVHGPEVTAAAAGATDVLFGGGDPAGAPPDTLDVVATAAPVTDLTTAELAGGAGGDRSGGVDLADLMERTGLAASRGEARRLLDQGGVSVNGAVATPGAAVGPRDLLAGRYLLLRRGKRAFAVVRVSESGAAGAP